LLFAQSASVAQITVENIPYQLETKVNGANSGLIVSYRKLADGRFGARRQDLNEIRVVPPGAGSGDDFVPLDSIPGLSYVYDEALQTISITVVADSLRRETLVAYDTEKTAPEASTTTGAVINYGLFSTFDQSSFGRYAMLDGTTLSLDGRLFGEWGTFENSGIIGSNDFESLRLQSTWSYSLQDSLVTFNAGDVVSGGLPWTRPIRMGGFQMRRNFGVRPDLITRPLPSLSGSAAVPSTVDVYVNNIRTYSRDIPSGPFTISNIPVVTGGGTARVVVRDASGRETVTEAPFYSSPDLLRKSVFDFSVEAGTARLNYGVESNDYDNELIAMASARFGYSDGLTISGHAEAGAGLFNGGAGLTAKLGSIGVASLALSASTYDGGTGAQIYGAFESRLGRVFFNARGQYAFGDYRDLASLSFNSFDNYFLPFSALTLLPPKSLAFVSAGVPLEALGGSLSFSFLHRASFENDEFNIANVGYSQRLRENVTLHASAFKDLTEDDHMGAFVGLSVSLGNRSLAAASYDYDRDGSAGTVIYSKSADNKPGSFGWQVRDTEGRRSVRQASVDYIGSKVRMRGHVAQADDLVAGSFYADGAVAVTADGMYTSRRIDDSFAIVETGAPDVEVSHENRVVGRTDENGRILVPSLRAWEVNKITINPDDMPATVQTPETRVKAVPRARSAVKVKFDLKPTTTAALVTVRDESGKFVAAGFTGRHVGSGTEFVVGYDGQIYLENLSSNNQIEIDLDGRTCRAEFQFTPEADTQTAIDGVVCK
jgi:outer membrane usher protein